MRHRHGYLLGCAAGTARMVTRSSARFAAAARIGRAGGTFADRLASVLLAGFTQSVDPIG
jgi:hypothetical protein